MSESSRDGEEYSADSHDFPREESIYVPPIKLGWMKKQGRKGVLKNWKRRYFVLNAGKISYFQEMADDAPFGKDLKGELNLANTEVIEENRRYNNKQIFVVSFGGDYNLLMETDTSDEADAWALSIKEHIKYANSENEDAVVNPDRLVSRKLKAVCIEEETSVKHQNARTSTGSSSSFDLDSPTRSFSSEPEVEEEFVSFKPYMEDLLKQTQQLIGDFATSSEQRGKCFEALTTAAKELFTSAATSAKGGGDFGSRGEAWLLFQVLLFCSILVTLHPRLEQLIKFFIGMSATAYITFGLLMMIAAGYELRGNFSFFAEPVEGNKLATKGIYRVVRHPMYGGAVLLCLGCSIAQGKLEKIILSLMFALVLAKVSEKEEALLLQEHPLAYRNFINSRWRFVPFVF